MKLKNSPSQIVSKLKKSLPIDRTLVNTLYTLSVKSLLTAIIFTLLITIFLYSELSNSIILWACVLVPFLAFRLYYAYLFKKTPQIYSIEIWYEKFMLFAFITGVMVSTLGFVFIHYLDDYYQLFVLASLLGLTAGATTSLSSDFRIAIIYISIIMFPLIVSMAMLKTSLAFILPVLLTLFFFSQVLMIFNSYTQEVKIKELKIQQDLLNNIFSESPLAMFSYDTHLNILYANKQLRKMFECEKQKMTGINLNIFMDPNLTKVFQNTLNQGSQSYLGPYTTLKDNTLWIKIAGFSFKDSNHMTIGGVGIVENKTKEYQNKNELDALHTTVKNELNKNQFLLNENKQFIADMVHQIRTPLTVIMANASLIEMQSEKNVSSYIAQINSAINMLSNAYEDLSYIISNDTIEYMPIKINFTDFLNERINFFEVIAQANDKTVNATIADNIKITMNDTELERLIDNNLSNAIKHSSDKSEIEIVLEENSTNILLKFISEGKNIRDVSMIFDRNYTETHSAKRSLGLGLNMVKTICEKNDIRYSAHSEKGINTFTYTFIG